MIFQSQANDFRFYACLWTEYIPTTWKAEFAIFPRMSALAENVWSPLEKKDWTNFDS